MNHQHLDLRALVAMKEHAIQEYAFHDKPRESCGLIIGGIYYPCENTHATPETHFRIEPAQYLQLASDHGPIEAVIHSHPDGPFFPSQADMEEQIHTGVPWGIVATDGEQASDPIMWGDSLPIAPLIGRTFMHGVWDCYSAIRDTFRLGSLKLKELEVGSWPYAPITLLEFPRNDNWWVSTDDLYSANFGKAGFIRIAREEARPGDVFLCKIKSEKLNHGGVLLGNDLILHHLPGRLSRREPAGIWARAAEQWIRYNG